MDTLTEIIALLRPHAVFSKPISGRGRWGVRYAAPGSPSFCIVLKGRCWLTLEGRAPRLLERGDYLLLPSTPAFTLASQPGVECAAGNPSATAGVRHGERRGAADFRMIGGTFRLEFASAALLGLVIEQVHLRAAECDTSRLRSIVDLIMDEYASRRPGREMILNRLLEVMLIESLRWRRSGTEAAGPGLVAGLSDTSIEGALRAMHSEVGRGWTVAELAQGAGMSRSAFAARFTAKVGCAPIEYLARWRMVLAQDALSRGGIPLDRLAERIGYESASAFSTAFRRRIGCAPGAYARSCRQARAD